jgi:trehalose 6-phosphate synthase
VAIVAGSQPLVVVSNRGPVSFSRAEDGSLVAKRGAGGLVSSLGPLVRDTGALWLAAAITDEDREAATDGPVEAEGFRVQTMALDVETYRMFYDVIANTTLWFLHHDLFDHARRPRLDARWRRAWDAYRHVNRLFADAIIEQAPPGAIVLVQDYHFALVGTWLAQQRRDLHAVHFTHIPFCEPGTLRMLPTDVGEELLVGMSSHQSCGFHSRRWATNFSACCRDVIGFEPATFVSPLAVDLDDICRTADSDECEREAASLRELVGTRRMILRVDRMELSKNLLRGFWAYDELLHNHRELRGEVVFVAFAYPSRENLPEYLAYRQEVETLARLLNDRWSTPDWTPVLLDTSDNFPRSVASLRLYDVLLVNPVRDGLNLVAKEGALLNERDGVLVLSREAGVCEEIGGAGAIVVNPFDVSETAEALATALAMGPSERAVRATSLAKEAGRRTIPDWLADQLRAARETRPRR